MWGFQTTPYHLFGGHRNHRKHVVLSPMKDDAETAHGTMVNGFVVPKGGGPIFGDPFAASGAGASANDEFSSWAVLSETI